MAQGRTLTEEQIALVRELFPDHTKSEIKAIVGVAFSTIDRLQARYHLKKTPEHLHNMGVKAGKASNIARGGKFIGNLTPVAIAKRTASYRERIHKEEILVKYGFKQRTRLRLKTGSKGFHDQASYLRQHGYVVDKEKQVAYYNADTIRTRRLEKLTRGENKGPMHCYFEFKPYKDYAERTI